MPIQQCTPLKKVNWVTLLLKAIKFIQMNNKRCFALIGFLIILCLNAQAEETGLCDKLEVVKANSQQQVERFTLTQFGFDRPDFDAGARDLAIIVHNVNLPASIKRVTFNRGKLKPNCFFKPVAFAQGGQNSQILAEQFWGWHMLWTEASKNLPQGLFYARMDGEAWVSSNPKVLTKLAAINPQFNQQNQIISITWQQLEVGVTVNMRALSVDEGRSWEIAPIKP